MIKNIPVLNLVILVLLDLIYSTIPEISHNIIIYVSNLVKKGIEKISNNKNNE